MRSPEWHEDPHSFYPIELPVSYELEGGRRISGQGRTLAISSQSVRLDCGQRLPLRVGIRLFLAWPVALPDGTRLNLWIRGEIMRSASDQSTIRVIRYDFKTRRPGRLAQIPLREDARHSSFRQIAAGGD